MTQDGKVSTQESVRRAGLFIGAAIFVVILVLPEIGGLGDEATVVLALLVLMAIWWVTEAIPIPITSLLPLVVLPSFGVVDMRAAAAPYFHPVVVLLFGGFIAATAVERWRLHERLALLTLLRAGSGRSRLIAGFLVASAMLSAWISNTATCIMLMPVALSVAYACGGRKGEGMSFTVSVILAVAYGASIGGLATPIGTPTNLIVIGALEQTGDMRLSFARWMAIGLPTVLLLLPAAWWVLASRLDPQDQQSADPIDVVRARLSAMGPWSVPERRTLMVFAVMAFFWSFRRAFLQDLSVFGVQPFAHLSDAVIAVAGAIAMFLVPSGAIEKRGSALLDWETAEAIPWGVLLLFGGGLSMAAAVTSTGLGAWLGDQMGALSLLWPLVLIMILTLFTLFATEMTSNVAASATLMPVILVMGTSTGIDPATLAVPVGLAASCAFMFPMATAPNAIAYGTGEMSIARMARIGLSLNLLAAIVITGVAAVLTPLLL
ncbi:MAG: DASS family sodium-coupled anion symporter [Pseudomonadota bacterium]